MWGSRGGGKLRLRSLSSCCCPKALPVIAAVTSPATNKVRRACLFIGCFLRLATVNAYCTRLGLGNLPETAGQGHPESAAYARAWALLPPIAPPHSKPRAATRLNCLF